VGGSDVVTHQIFSTAQLGGAVGGEVDNALIGRFHCGFHENFVSVQMLVAEDVGTGNVTVGGEAAKT
jgi:hypothetical protein